MRRAPRLVDEVQRLGVTVSVAALVIVLLVVARLVWSATVGMPLNDRLQSGLLAVEDAHQSMLVQESALRGHLATADPAFLARADLAAPELAIANARLGVSLEEPELRADVLDLRLAQERWIREWAEPARQLPPPGAVDAFLRQGEVLFAEYRAAKEATRDDLLAAIDAANANNRFLQWGLGLVLVAIALGTLALALRGRSRLRRHVVAPVDGLLASVRGIGEGRLQPPATVTGSAELVALRDGLADMTVALGRQREESTEQAERLRAQTDRLRTIVIMAREIAGSLNTRYVIDSTVQAAVAVTDARVLLWLLDDDGHGIELAHDSERGTVPPLEGHCTLGVGLVGRTARYGQVFRGDPDADDDAGVAVPLVVGARVIGVLECCDRTTPAAGADDPVVDAGVDAGAGDRDRSARRGRQVEGQTLAAVEMLATVSASAIEASRLHAATERLSQFDPLTQLANRRRMNADMDSAVAAAKRHGHAIAVIMLDLDHFKELNDRYGHQQGDVVLQEVSSTIRGAMREGESAYRYGGEEFAILVTRGGADDAAALAERLRGRIEVDFHRKGKQLVTASLGVAGMPEHAGDGESLVAEADRALYSAKHSGRNRVHRAGV